jgi:hypothetical protein
MSGGFVMADRELIRDLAIVLLAAGAMLFWVVPKIRAQVGARSAKFQMLVLIAMFAAVLGLSVEETVARRQFRFSSLTAAAAVGIITADRIRNYIKSQQKP